MINPDGARVLTEEDIKASNFSGMSEERFESFLASRSSEWEQFKDKPIELPRAPLIDRGASRIHGYKNYTSQGPVSYCGQAAVATTWDYWGFDPGYAGPRVVSDPWFPSGPQFWNDIHVVDEIRARFDNDVGGMSQNRLLDALRAAPKFVADWGWGPQTTYESIARFVNNSVPIPVICLLKWGDVWPNTLHWVSVFALSDGQVWFTNPAKTDGVNDPNDPAQLSNEKWRVGGLSYEDFGNRWSWTGLTKCHIVSYRTA